jgi:hypothetical protein
MKLICVSASGVYVCVRSELKEIDSFIHLFLASLSV